MQIAFSGTRRYLGYLLADKTERTWNAKITPKFNLEEDRRTLADNFSSRHERQLIEHLSQPVVDIGEYSVHSLVRITQEPAEAA